MQIVIAGWLAAISTLPLMPQAPIEVPKTPGAFDYMLVDTQLKRLLIAHTGSHAFAIADISSGAMLGQLDVGGPPHGIAIDVRDDAYLVGTSGQPQVVVVDRHTLRILKSIRMPGPVDAVALDTRRDVLYADADNGASIWLLSNGRIIHTLATPQDSDKSAYDELSDRVYQNFTTANAMYVIDPAKVRFVASWSTLPAQKPHGLALDDARHRVYVAGTNGVLVALDLRTGVRLGSAPIARNVDQIAFDPERARIYCASGDGFVSVVSAGPAGVAHVADVPVPAGAHTLALDPSSGALWISYGTPKDDYIMKLVPF
ncbi:MAG: hypothetical protein JO293_08190 [Candidatus Eremiobacteraeota bacterium]|nr:hypothetical protein [Candidatus Eremiobacteraeota bacterium]MBV8223328.1 hypothetical protein [Candidatus Eremiobacteraeota bacterium]